TVIVALLPADPAGTSVYELGTPRRAAALILDRNSPRPPCARLPDGLFNLCLPVGTNVAFCFRVEATDDLSHWTPLCTLPTNEDTAHFIDPDADGLLRRFYRIRPDVCDLEE